MPKKRKKLVTTDWREIVRLWSVQAAGVLTAVSGAYAGSDALQQMVSPAQFASFMAVANLLVIVLRTLNQGSTK